MIEKLSGQQKSNSSFIKDKIFASQKIPLRYSFGGVFQTNSAVKDRYNHLHSQKLHPEASVYEGHILGKEEPKNLYRIQQEKYDILLKKLFH